MGQLASSVRRKRGKERQQGTNAEAARAKREECGWQTRALGGSTLAGESPNLNSKQLEGSSDSDDSSHKSHGVFQSPAPNQLDSVEGTGNLKTTRGRSGGCDDSVESEVGLEARNRGEILSEKYENNLKHFEEYQEKKGQAKLDSVAVRGVRAELADYQQQFGKFAQHAGGGEGGEGKTRGD